MFDNNFDPYQELMLLKHNTQELINGHNHHDQAIAQMANHYTAMMKTVKALQVEVRLLREEIRRSKSAETK